MGMSFFEARLSLNSAQLMPSWPSRNATSQLRHNLTLQRGHVKIVKPSSIQKLYLQFGVMQFLFDLELARTRPNEMLS